MAFIRNTDKLIEGVVNQFFTDSRARTAVITQLITNGVTDRAPSEDAVYDALALKLDSSLKGAVNGLAELDGSGKIPSSQIPDVGLIDVSVVADNAAKAALTPQEGDVALQTDNSKAYIYDGSAWQEITKDAFARAAAVVNSSAGNETDQAMSVSAAKTYVGNAVSGLASETYVTNAINALDTDDIEQGSTNLYFTDAAAKSAVVVNSSAGSETDQAMSVLAAKGYSEDMRNEAQKFIGHLHTFSSSGSITSSMVMCLVDLTGGSVTLTLPNVSGLVAGRKFIVKDQKGLASQSVYITVQREGSSEKIDGANTYEMKAAYESISLMWDGSNWLVF